MRLPNSSIMLQEVGALSTLTYFPFFRKKDRRYLGFQFGVLCLGELGFA